MVVVVFVVVMEEDGDACNGNESKLIENTRMILDVILINIKVKGDQKKTMNKKNQSRCSRDETDTLGEL